MTRHSWVRSALGVLAAIALAWAFLVFLVGGFTIRLGILRFGSRDPLRALLLAAAIGALYFRLSRLGEWRSDFHRVRAVLIRGMVLRPDVLLAIFLAVATAVVGIKYGTFVAAGSDSYGYVSQAELWERGSLRVPQPLAPALPWPNAMDTLTTLGYRPAPHGNDLVPTYAPGLPLLMVVFRKVLGARGQYYVVPVLGGLLVWLTYLLGVRLTARKSVGLSAALVLAASPPVLFSLMTPMSDVPIAAVWTLAVLLALPESAAATLACGLTASLAVLVRPNLVPVTAVFGTYFLCRGIAKHGASLRSLAPALLFSLGAIPGPIIVALVNNNLYGSPFASGYAEMRFIYAWSNITVNAPRYASWVIQSGCVYVLLGIAAAFVFWPGLVRSTRPGFATRVLAAGLVLAIAASYLFYLRFNDWWYLRFFLSIWPVTIVLAAALALDLLTRVRLPGASAVLIAIAIVLFARGYRRAQAYGIFQMDESRCVTVGDYIAKNTEPDAVILAMQHSGSLRYYAGRVTVRYDFLARASLEQNVDALTKLGRHTYIVLDEWEVPEFKSHFAKESRLARLDWPPLAEFPGVVVYDTRAPLAPR